MGSIICCSNIEAPQAEEDSERDTPSYALPPVIRELSRLTVIPNPS